jgi:DNA-binding response OmpR family regulator
MKKVLVIEDDPDIARLVATHLEDLGCRVQLSDSGDEGLQLAMKFSYDLLVLDVMLPGMSGIEVCEKIRAANIPCSILMLTAKSEEVDKVLGLDSGADDYLTKPFGVKEFIARVKVIFRRAHASHRLPEKNVGGFGIKNGWSSASSVALSMNEKFLLHARRIVENNIGNPDFSVEQMAREMHRSRTQLFRKMKAVTQLSPNEYINELRLERAATLILSRADTLTQITYSVGFNEQSYFAKRFRKKFGVTPSEYYSKVTGNGGP